MSDDQPFRKPDLQPRLMRELQLLFEFRKGTDSYACELRDHGEFGVEAQFLLNGEPYIARTFRDLPDLKLRARDVAVHWAHRQRATME